MGSERIQYKKLPGHRRGLVNGSSVWLGPDHLLLVKSQRFKEEYKRFYLRDIQAIAIARYGRFHLSTRSLLLAVLWFFGLGMSQAYPAMTGPVWTAALILIGAWLYVSVDRSCVCRIYTAVSSDVLPSVYRTWTARRFLAAVEPRIREVQGEIDPAWLEAPDPQRVGPELPRTPSWDAPSRVVATGEALGPAAAQGALRTPASDIFLATLLLEAVLNAVAFRVAAHSLDWVLAGIVVMQSIAAVFVFIDRSRERLRSAVHKVAIAKLIWLTILFYIDTGLGAMMRTNTLPLVPVNDTLRGIDLALSIALLAVGLTVSFRSAAEPPHTLMGS